MAAKNAADTIRQRLAKFAAERFSCQPNQVQFANGQVRYGEQSMRFAELADQAYLAQISLSATGFYATPDIHYDRASHTGAPFFYFTHGAAVSEVEVDVRTGENRVRRVDILHSVGNSLNPAIDLGQIEGAFVQGMGWLTDEEICFDEQGRLTTHAPSTYKIPTASDRPDHFNIALFASNGAKAKTIYRSKAVGEPPFMLALSVHSALRAAIAAVPGHDGFAALDAPATPETLFKALPGK
jgi:xanthine dehydrogenase large subunit